MTKSPTMPQHTVVQPEPSVTSASAPEQRPATHYVESVRITPERIYNALVKIHERQRGDQ